MVNQMARLFTSYNLHATLDDSIRMLMQTEMLLTLEGGVELAVLLVDSLVSTMMLAKVSIDPTDYLQDICDRVVFEQTKHLEKLCDHAIMLRYCRTRIMNDPARFNYAAAGIDAELYTGLVNAWKAPYDD